MSILIENLYTSLGSVSIKGTLSGRSCPIRLNPQLYVNCSLFSTLSTERGVGWNSHCFNTSKPFFAGTKNVLLLCVFLLIEDQSFSQHTHLHASTNTIQLITALALRINIRKPTRTKSHPEEHKQTPYSKGEKFAE